MKSRINRISYYLNDIWIRVFWQHPNRLMALKVTTAVTLLLVPAIILGFPRLGGTLALGALGGAIAETDDHPKGRVKSLALTIIGFLISSTSVELLHPYPALFALGLFVSSFSFIILGGLSERYRGITFATLLVSIYTMLGLNPDMNWYFQPLTLASGGLFYGIISLVLLARKPWRPLQEQLSIGYKQLAQYIEIKAKLFPSDETTQDYTRNQLAQKNIELVQAIKNTHRVLRSYASEIGKKDENLGRYYRKWLILQQLHERAASSHESYDLLTAETVNIRLIEGFGQLLNEIGKAVGLYAEALIVEKPYKHPISLQWTVAALADMMAMHKDETQFTALSLLYKNLTQMERILHSLEEPVKVSDVPSDYEPLSVRQRLKLIFKKDHPRFKYALRLSITLLTGYALMHYFDLVKGEWILLTSLFVMQESFMSTRQRFIERVMGTLYGIVVGVLLLQLLPTLTGNILLLLAAYYLFFFYTKDNYAVAVIFVTIIVMALFNIQFDQGMEVMGPRIMNTIAGSLLAYISVRFILPDWQYRNLSQLLSNALSSNKAYFESIYNDVDTEVYNETRQRAHEADTALTSAWQSIRVEPKGAQLFKEKAFRLTYLNHTMLSYISAFGAHHKNKSMDAEDLVVCRNISDILSEAHLMLTTKECSGKIQDEKVLHEEGGFEAQPRHAIILLSNIRRFAKELYLEAKEMS